MHETTRRFVLVAAAASALAAPIASPRPAAAATDFEFHGPILARDSALGCFGKTPSDETRLVRDTLTGLYNSGNAITTVLCPINRRNMTPYYEDSVHVDQIGLRRVDIFVRNNSMSTPVKCQIYAWSNRNNSAHATSFVSASSVGFTTISFVDPFGAGVLLEEAIANIGYACQIPKAGSNTTSGIIGSEAIFDPN
jgi:hypothetical protein